MIDMLATELRAFYRLWQAHFAAEMRALGLSISRAQAILCLAEAGEPIVQNQLAHLLDLEEPTVARMLDGMAKNGLIRREKLSSDKRENYIVLCDKAAPLAEDIKTARTNIRNRAFGTLTEDEMQMVWNIMHRLRQGLGEVAIPGKAVKDRNAVMDVDFASGV